MKKFSSTMKANSRRNSSTKRIRVIVGVLLVVLLLGYLVPRVASFVGGVVLLPVTTVSGWFSTSQAVLPTYLRTRAVLDSELTDLREEIALEDARNAELTLLRSENADLLSLKNATAASGTAAHVIAQPPHVPYDRVVVNKGSTNGVVIGAPVYVGENVVIGAVIATTPWQSVVELISSPDTESTVYIFGPDIYTTAVGQGGGVLKIGVPQGIELSVADPVTTPAGGRGILGSISHIESEATRPEQYAYVTLPIAAHQLRTVFIGSEPINTMSFEAARAAVEATRSEYFTVEVPDGVLVDIPEVATSTATSSEATTTVDTI